MFHDAAIPPDDFVANCTIAFEDLAHRDKEQQDFWVKYKSDHYYLFEQEQMICMHYMK